MGKKILFLLVLFFFLPLFSINAQQKSERWVCLKAEKTAGHTATVSVDPATKPLANNNTYVFECLSTSECTSGNAAIDQEVFGKNNLEAMLANYGYHFEGSSLPSNPTMTNGSGDITPFTWKSSTEHGHARRWLALNYFDPTPTPSTATGNEGGQQLGTFDFEAVINNSDCVSLSWDPYGRVFDSSTLNPVSGANVTLLKKRDNNSFTLMTSADLLGGNIINPQTTKEDGGFSFVVPDGTYKLSVTQGKYVFPEQLANIQSNYVQIYSDIYPDPTGEEIVQAGAIQHRDIPLSPKTTSQNNEVKLMEFFYNLNKANSTIYVKGRVSHPFAKIKTYSLRPDPVLQEIVRYRLLTKTPIKADAQGNFTLKIDQSDFEPEESFGDITAEKVDLTQIANLVESFKKWFLSLIGEVNAQVTLATNFRLDPIPNYLEGYAYDAQGKVMPDATVSVVLDFSNKPSYQTKADENGYFKISSEFLPSMPYKINYISPSGQKTEISTSKFIVQNQEVIQKSDIKINQYKNEKGQMVSSAPKEMTNVNATENQSKEVISKSIKALTSNNILPFILAAIATLMIGIMATVIYIKRKHS